MKDEKRIGGRSKSYWFGIGMLIIFAVVAFAALPTFLAMPNYSVSNIRKQIKSAKVTLKDYDDRTVNQTFLLEGSAALEIFDEMIRHTKHNSVYVSQITILTVNFYGENEKSVALFTVFPELGIDARVSIKPLVQKIKALIGDKKEVKIDERRSNFIYSRRMITIEE